MSIKRALLLGLLFFLATLICTAPATILSKVVSNYTQHQLLLNTAQGTVWHGEAQVSIKSLLEEYKPPEALGHLRWDFKPSELITGKIAVTLQWNNNSPATITVNKQGVSVKNLTLDAPASALMTLIPSLNAAQLGGLLQLQSEYFLLNYPTQNDATFEGLINIDWQQASSLLSPVFPLGHYHAAITGTDNMLNIELSTIDGALVLNGKGAWNISSGLSFNGSAKAGDSQKVALEPLLHVLGNEATLGSGEYQMTFGY